VFDSLPTPDAARALVLAELARHDSPVRGAAIQATLAALITPDVRALEQNARANGRRETQLANAFYRAFRTLKASGYVAVVAPATFELTDAGRNAAKSL